MCSHHVAAELDVALVFKTECIFIVVHFIYFDVSLSYWGLILCFAHVSFYCITKHCISKTLHMAAEENIKLLTFMLCEFSNILSHALIGIIHNVTNG